MNYNNIIRELETKGYVEIDNFISNENIHNIKKFVDLKKNEFNTDNFSLADNELNHKVFNEIKNSQKFKELYENILKSQNISINNNTPSLLCKLKYKKTSETKLIRYCKKIQSEYKTEYIYHYY